MLIYCTDAFNRKTIIKRVSLLTLVFALYFGGTTSIMAQFGEEPAKKTNKIPFRDRLNFGGNIGGGFGPLGLNILVNPQVGITINENFMVGVGGTYMYFRFRDPFFGDFSTNIAGASVFGRHRVYDNFFAHAEFENLWLDALNFNGELSRVSVPIFLVGGGYLQPLGGNSSAIISVLWDVIDDRNSPYINPIIRGGFVFGF
ncbi:MAG: hypothetical protein ACXITV_01660 [Luteibaculaceae bacterium]